MILSWHDYDAERGIRSRRHLSPSEPEEEDVGSSWPRVSRRRKSREECSNCATCPKGAERSALARPTKICWTFYGSRENSEWILVLFWRRHGDARRPAPCRQIERLPKDDPVTPYHWERPGPTEQFFISTYQVLWLSFYIFLVSLFLLRRRSRWCVSVSRKARAKGRWAPGVRDSFPRQTSPARERVLPGEGRRHSSVTKPPRAKCRQRPRTMSGNKSFLIRDLLGDVLTGPAGARLAQLAQEQQQRCSRVPSPSEGSPTLDLSTAHTCSSPGASPPLRQELDSFRHRHRQEG